MISETLEQLENLIRNKTPLSPSGWLDIIGRVVVEMGDETDMLYSLQKQVANAKMEVMELETNMSVAEAKNIVEATDLYEMMQKQKAKCHKIEELIRIGKLQSKLREGEWGAGNL